MNLKIEKATTDLIRSLQSRDGIPDVYEEGKALAWERDIPFEQMKSVLSGSNIPMIATSQNTGRSIVAEQQNLTLQHDEN